MSLLAEFQRKDQTCNQWLYKIVSMAVVDSLPTANIMVFIICTQFHQLHKCETKSVQ